MRGPDLSCQHGSFAYEDYLELKRRGSTTMSRSAWRTLFVFLVTVGLTSALAVQLHETRRTWLQGGALLGVWAGRPGTARAAAGAEKLELEKAADAMKKLEP